MQTKEGKKTRQSLFLQVLLYFVISALAVGTLTYFTQRGVTEETVQRQIEFNASKLAQEVERSIQEYPAWEWLIRYWSTHDDTLNIEYDVSFSDGRRTVRKDQQLSSHQPLFQIRYANAGAAQLLPEEDQKLFAEITYSWLNTRLNAIKQSDRVDYLFVILTDKNLEEQYFLLSAADAGAVRGTNYEEVYPLGVRVSVKDNEHQREAMRSAAEQQSRLFFAGKYADYYACIGEVDDRLLMVGMTYNMSGILDNIGAGTLRSTLWSVAYQAGLSAVLMTLLYFFVLRPFHRVQQNIRLYTETKDCGAVENNLRALAEGRSEISELSRDVIGMTAEIDNHVRRIESITADRERIGAELALASRIQARSLPSTFPPFPDRTEFDIFASMDPAKEVGGDFYDFFFVDEDHLALVIADVSGKGIPAALFMMVSMLLIHNAVQQEPSPGAALKRVNDQICSNNPEEMFVSVWLGILEISSGRMTAANAGHEYPAVKKAAGSFELLKDRHGFVIGGMPGIKFKEYELQLEPGDKLFVYTDGVPEATNGAQELFGTERMVEALRQGESGTPKETLEAVNRAVQAFVGDAPQFDDLTMMCLAYQGR